MKLTQRQLTTLYAISNLNQRPLLPSELAKVIGVHRLTVVRWIKDGLLPHHRHGRHLYVLPSALAEFERPEQTYGPKLSRDDVRRIRRRQKQGETPEAVFKDYESQITELSFTRIWTGKTFKGVE